MLEERVGGVAKASYVWSPVYVDALVSRDRGADGSSANGLEERLYALADANYNVTALVSVTGVVVEPYAYDPFGKASVLDAGFAARAGGTGYGWVVLFQGLRRDGVSGLDYARNRDYSAALGRWVTMDPIGFVAGDINLYRFESNTPTVHLDPTGLADYNINLMDNLLFKGLFHCSDSGNKKMIVEVSQKRSKYIEFIRPRVVQEAVIRALRDILKMPQEQVDKLNIGLGKENRKSQLSATDYKLITGFLAAKLSSSTTTSGDSASSVKMHDNWELKIYKNGDNYSISVVTQAGSLEHIGDALDYYLNYPINARNAADFIGGPVYTQESMDLLDSIIQNCGCKPNEALLEGREKILKTGIKLK